MKVLLVEDDPDILKLLAMTLRFDGRFDVVQAASGPQGLALAKRERPDLIVLDVMMPHMDGYETLRLLKNDPETEGIPVIFLSARAQDKELERGISLGAVGYLTKPFDPLKLPSRLLELAGH